MDFADFDLAKVSEVGVWHHLELQGKKLYRTGNKIGPDESDKPCRVMLKGIGTPKVMGLLREIGRIGQIADMKASRVKGDAYDAILSDADEKTEAAFGKLIDAAVTDWENIVISGQEAECTRENKAKVVGPKTPFFQQTYDAILAQRDFFTDAAKS